MFGGVENVFSSILFGIPAVKAVEFGDGFACCGRRGSENNDSFYYNESRQVKTRKMCIRDRARPGTNQERPSPDRTGWWSRTGS